MALPTKEERIRRKKVMQAAGINVPNTDESWGPWWDKQWKKAITHTKTNDYYGDPSIWNLAHRTFDNITGNTTYEAEPQPIGGTIQATDNSAGAQIKRTLNNWQHEGDPARDVVLALMPDPIKPVKVGKAAVKAVPQLVKSVPKLFTKEGAKKLGRAVIREAPKVTADYLGGIAVDKISEATTGKSWAENAADKMSDIAGFHIEPIFGEITNPGYIGRYTAASIVRRQIQKPTAKDLTPKVYDYVSNLYLDNGDGTWSYNNDYVQAVRRKHPTPRYIMYNFSNGTPVVPRQPVVFVEPSELGLPLKPNKSYLAGDFLTGNTKTK